MHHMHEAWSNKNHDTHFLRRASYPHSSTGRTPGVTMGTDATIFVLVMFLKGVTGWLHRRLGCQRLRGYMVQSYARNQDGNLKADEPSRYDDPTNAISAADDAKDRKADLLRISGKEHAERRDRRNSVLRRYGALPKYAEIALGLDDHSASGARGIAVDETRARATFTICCRSAGLACSQIDHIPSGSVGSRISKIRNFAIVKFCERFKQIL